MASALLLKGPIYQPLDSEKAESVPKVEEISAEDRKQGQVDSSHESPQVDAYNIIVSPYLTKPHLLYLPSLDKTSQLLALALSYLSPVSPSYATTPYDLAFNWTEVFENHLASLLPAQDADILWPGNTTLTYYVVYFRSILKPSIDIDLLSRLDEESHAEATASGGLLKYWFGSPDTSRRNLATCLWRSREDALKGGTGPWHRRAREAAGDLYESIEFGRLSLHLTRKDWGVIHWSFEKAKD